MKNRELIKADNSSGVQYLKLDYQKEGPKKKKVFFFYITGRLDGKTIQIDFSAMKKREVKKLIRRLKKAIK